MPFHDAECIRYYAFESLSLPGVKQAIFTRKGGVSAGPWDSLNVGSTVGDQVEHVRENLQRALSALELSTESVYDVWQVHGNHVVEATRARAGRAPVKADAIITNRRGVTLLMRFADCVPILLLDPVSGSIGMAHAGWQGTVKNVAGAVVNKMKEVYGADPADIRAGIGPSICQNHYQVGSQVISAVQKRFGKAEGNHLEDHADGTYFDLWSANQVLLEQAGVVSIEVAGECTAGAPDFWYSHRASGGKTGRFAALITYAD